jgi:hypothetical protein
MAASAFLVIPSASHYRNDCNGGFSGSSFISHLIAMCVLLCGGGYLSIWSQQELSNGISLDRWTEEQLRPVRMFSKSRIATMVPVAVMVLALALYVRKNSAAHHSFATGYWFCFVLCNGLMGLRRSLAAPKDSHSAPWLETSAPLRSEHWGE